MAIERTFSIIKPDATARNLTGAINALIEKAGLRIVAQKRIRMTREQAETFYAVHKARPFFGELVDFMISGAGGRASARRRERGRSSIAKSWARPTRPRRPMAPSASSMRNRSAKTRCMDRTRPKPRLSKSRSFSPATR